MLKSIFGAYLRRCAKISIKRSKPYIIGITGSIWKTTARMIISHILQKSILDIRVSTSPKNFNSEIWLALSILEIEQYSPTILGTISAFFQALSAAFVPSRSYDVVVLEYGIDQPWDMDILLDMTIPHMAIFTGLDKVHSVAFESPDEILYEKSKLLLAAEDVVMVPAGVWYLDEIIDDIQVDVLDYALGEDVDANISFGSYELTTHAMYKAWSQFVLDQWNEHITHITSNLVWEVFAGYTSLGIEIAMIVARRMWVEYDLQEELLFDLQPGRYSLYDWIHDSIIIDSSYNAAPESMRMTIQQTIHLRNTLFPDHKLIYCLWDMNELWDFAESEHRKLALLVTQSAEHIFVMWEQMWHLIDESKKIWFDLDRITHSTNARDMWQLIQQYITNKNQKYIILVKASQWNLYIEEAIPFLLSDASDVAKLPRHSARRQKKKWSFFGIE